MSDTDRYFDASVLARFFSKIAFGADDECWLWTGGTTADGYGIFNIHYPIAKTAHRYMLELWLGRRLERRMDASHTCETRLCVNPRHLVAETHKQNCARRKKSDMKGHPSKSRKLTWEQAQAIRHSKEINRLLSARYKVNGYTIWAIKHGLLYKNPPVPSVR